MRATGPINIIPFRINNKSVFIDRNHPVLHPKTPEYKEYWYKVLDKCMYGIWGYDYDSKTKEGGYRWLPGNMWWYINITPIWRQGEDNSQEFELPEFKAIDLMKCYGLRVCEGFSGYDGDEEFTSDMLVWKLENGKKLKLPEEKSLKDPNRLKHIKKLDGTYKKYVDPREYLYKTHDKPLGRPLWKNEAQNWGELGTRGYGKSFYMSHAEICYDFVFNGCKTIEDFAEGKKNTTIVVGASKSDYSDELMYKFKYLWDYLQTRYGYHHDFIDGTTNGVFWTKTMGGITTKHSGFTNRYALEGGGYAGAGSTIYNVTYYKNSSAAVSKRARKIINDEAGTLDNFKEVHGENTAIQKRDTTFGFSAYTGSAGNLTAIEGIRDAFTKPRAYNILPYPDLFGLNNDESGFFVPSYYRNVLYLDAQGNHDIESAYSDELEERKRLLKDSPDAYDRYVISFPFYPHEMFLQSKQNLFPNGLLEERLHQLESGLWNKIAKVGWLEYKDKEKSEIEFKIDIKGELVPFNRYNSEKDAKHKKGAVVIYELPVEGKPLPTYLNPLYITVYDPVAKEGGGSSICAVIVFKFYQAKDQSKIQFNVVAEWYGRYDTLDENHEMAWKLATFYNSKLFPELNNADILRNARDTRRWHMLQPEPKQVMGNFKQVKKFDVGVYITPGMKGDLALYLNEVFNTEVGIDITEENGSITSKPIKMASQIPSIRVCDEALRYGEGNFDAISAMMLVSLIHRDQVLIPHYISKEEPTQMRHLNMRLNSLKKQIFKKHPAYIK